MTEILNELKVGRRFYVLTGKGFILHMFGMVDDPSGNESGKVFLTTLL